MLAQICFSAWHGQFTTQKKLQDHQDYFTKSDQNDSDKQDIFISKNVNFWGPEHLNTKVS